jgi:glucose-6-phosphate isomerase
VVCRKQRDRHSPDPATLGCLVALYEHSVFTQRAIWDIR